MQGPRIVTRVVVGGELSDNKGINKQGGGLSAGALTDKDRTDIKLAAELGVDYLAVSFARDGSDMDEARQLLRAQGGHAHLVAKIERISAVRIMADLPTRAPITRGGEADAMPMPGPQPAYA